LNALAATMTFAGEPADNADKSHVARSEPLDRRTGRHGTDLVRWIAIESNGDAVATTPETALPSCVNRSRSDLAWLADGRRVRYGNSDGGRDL